MIRLGDRTGNSKRLAVLALLGLLLAPFACLCNCPSTAPQEPSPSGQVDAAEEILPDNLEDIGELEDVLTIPEFDPARVEYESDEEGSLERAEYPLEEDVLFGEVSTDISLVYTSADERVYQELVYAFQNVGEIDSLLIELPKSFVESVDSVADFHTMTDRSGLDIADVVIHETDALLELIGVKIRAVNAKLSLSGRALDIDLQKPGAAMELADAIQEQAEEFALLKVRQALRLAEGHARAGDEETAGLYFGILLALYPDSFSLPDCDHLRDLSDRMPFSLCRAITGRDVLDKSWRECDRLPETDPHRNFFPRRQCRLMTYVAFARKCDALPSREEIDDCLTSAAVDSNDEGSCEKGHAWVRHRIEDPALQTACIAAVRQDPELCERIAQRPARARCCNLMEDPEARNRCLERIPGYDYRSWFTEATQDDRCTDLRPVGARYVGGEVLGTGELRTLVCSYQPSEGGDVSIQISAYASDVDAAAVWRAVLDTFDDLKSQGTFTDYVTARRTETETYTVQRPSPGFPDFRQGYLIGLSTVHGNCTIIASADDSPRPEEPAVREMVDKAKGVIDRLRRN